MGIKIKVERQKEKDKLRNADASTGSAQVGLIYAEKHGTLMTRIQQIYADFLSVFRKMERG
jgi:hypothetical protein